MDKNMRFNVFSILADFYLYTDTTLKGITLVSDVLNKMKYSEIKWNSKPRSNVVKRQCNTREHKS